jgi:Arc/MetJ-type ribon-helix-helix transcriptional regulator
VFNQKTRMISFRVSEEDFRLLREVCLGEGFGSCSDLVRTAVQELISNRSQRGATAVADAVQSLITRVELIDQSLKGLMNSVNLKVVHGLGQGGEQAAGQLYDLGTNSPNNSERLAL